jgi:glycosyltransferase involved in cell wall biosynthesis
LNSNAALNVPLVTVAICCFNGERYLERTLNSVLAQDYPNFDVVIVDDGSTDGTAKIIERFAGKDGRIRAFFRSNHGLPSSRNFSFRQAQGEWMAIIDQDDLWYPARLSRQMEIAQSVTTAGFVFCNAHHINDSGDVIGDHLSAYVLPGPCIRKGNAGDQLLRQGCYSASVSCLIKRDTALAVGAFDESIPYACDYDYFIRAGFVVDFAYTRDCLAAWRRHAEAATSTYGKRDREIRSVLWRYAHGAKASGWTKVTLVKRILKSFIGGIVRKVGS